jgi:RNA recognition motif-containing protein
LNELIMITIYVGNVPFKARQEELEELFAPFGALESVRIITDKLTGNSRGFAFVKMDDKDAGLNAIEKLNGYTFMGKTLRVNEAQPREARPMGGGSNGGGQRPYRSNGGGSSFNSRRYND